MESYYLRGIEMFKWKKKDFCMLLEILWRVKSFTIFWFVLVFSTIYYVTKPVQVKDTYWGW